MSSHKQLLSKMMISVSIFNFITKLFFCQLIICINNCAIVNIAQRTISYILWTTPGQLLGQINSNALNFAQIPTAGTRPK